MKDNIKLNNIAAHDWNDTAIMEVVYEILNQSRYGRLNLSEMRDIFLVDYSAVSVEVYSAVHDTKKSTGKNYLKTRFDYAVSNARNNKCPGYPLNWSDGFYTIPDHDTNINDIAEQTIAELITGVYNEGENKIIKLHTSVRSTTLKIHKMKLVEARFDGIINEATGYPPHKDCPLDCAHIGQRIADGGKRYTRLIDVILINPDLHRVIDRLKFVTLQDIHDYVLDDTNGIPHDPDKIAEIMKYHISDT